MQLNHKTLGARNDLDYKGRVGIRWVDGAGYVPLTDDDDPGSAPPHGPSGVDPVDGARLELAFLAGKTALVNGRGPDVRRDGRAPCGSCVKCDQRLFGQCRRPVDRSVAQHNARVAEVDRIDAADATMVELQGVIYREESRRGLAF